VQYHDDIITSISLYAPRPDGEEWSRDEPHDMDWTEQKAVQLAARFLPTDVALDEPHEQPTNVRLQDGASDALAAEVPADVYAAVDSDDLTPGQCQVAFSFNDDGNVAYLSVNLRQDRPLSDGV